MATNSVIRLDDAVKHKSTRLSEKKDYYIIYILSPSGRRIPCILTEDDLAKGIDRATHNREDVVRLSFFQRLYNKILDHL